MKTETLDDARLVISELTEICQELKRENTKLREMLAAETTASPEQVKDFAFYTRRKSALKAGLNG